MKRLLWLSFCTVAACSGVGAQDLDGGDDASADVTKSDGSPDVAVTDGGADADPCPKTTPTGSTCPPGQCYCGVQPTSCYPESNAMMCCGQSVICATDGGGSPDASQCTFKHPLVDGSARYCDMGDCYCKWSTGESCYSTATAPGCCAGDSFTCY